MKMRVSLPDGKGFMVGSVRHIAADALENPWCSVKSEVSRRTMSRLLGALADKGVLDASEICGILNMEIDENDPPVFLSEGAG